VFKRTTIQAKEEERTNQSITQAQDEAKKLAEEAEANSKTLQQKIDEQASQLDEAQRGDRVAQDNLARQLRDAQSSINSTRTFAEEQAAKYAARNTR
jgi:Ni,Fe-hydrogenase III large subunit